MTTAQDLQAEYAEAWASLEEAKRKIVELCRRIGPERVGDYELQGREGGVKPFDGAQGEWVGCKGFGTPGQGEGIRSDGNERVLPSCEVF